MTFENTFCPKCKTKYWLIPDNKCPKCGTVLEIEQRINYQEIWDKGEDTYSKSEYEILKLERGGRLDGILDGCTVCPTGNSTCLETFDIILCGFHPDRHITNKRILICSLGITEEDSTKCVMNK